MMIKEARALLGYENAYAPCDRHLLGGGHCCVVVLWTSAGVAAALIPGSGVDHLRLKPRVADAVRAGPNLPRLPAPLDF